MKKLLVILVVILTLFLVGCNNEISVQDKDEVTSNNVVEIFLNQNEVWEDKAALESSFGTYIPGFTFFDIDLDGNKELAVQYSGGTMRNCTTKFYKVNGKKVEEVYISEPELNLSIAIGNLKKYKDSGDREFYLNMNTFKMDAVTYNTYLDEVVTDNGTIDLIHKFSYIETYENEGLTNKICFIGDTEVPSDIYDEKVNNYLKLLIKEEINFDFISYNDWKNYNDDERKAALLKAFNA